MNISPDMEQTYEFKINSTQGFLDYDMDFLRPIPIDIDREFEWLDLNQIYDTQWNYTVQINKDKLSEVKEIIQKALIQQISDQEIKLFQDYTEKDSNLLKNCGFNCSILPDLMEKNVQLAVFLMKQNYQSPQFQDYLEALLAIDITANTMEVLANLTNQVKIPIEYLTYYVRQSITKAMVMKEKNQQTRLVRYISIFVRVLIKHKQINHKDILTELQAFCIEFSKVNEASLLFKNIKNDSQQQQQ